MADLPKKANLLLIGLGPHAKQFYLPQLKKLIDAKRVNLLLGLDLASKKTEIENLMAEIGLQLPMWYIEPFVDQQCLPEQLSDRLNKFIEKNKINGVVIATEPLTHYAYAKWALSCGLNILMDKPITARENVASDRNQAKALALDCEDLLTDYENLQQEKETIFSICVQRRFDACHRKVAELIKEVADEFNAPVTSIQAMHSDGQWRLPSEIVTQIYHPYCQGYGKCSHSGYHIFDIVYQYLKAGRRPGKWPDSAEVFSSFVRPDGFIKQFNENDYQNYFGDGYAQVKKWTDADLAQKYSDYGEMDAFNVIRLIKDGVNIGNISINLLHNSFARRHWIMPGSDLYKGNGRVKHQCYQIQQGPFQNIQVHSYQANDKHSEDNSDKHKVGGDDHFDIYVFRNSAMFKKPQPPLAVYTIEDLIPREQIKRGPNKIAKEQSLLEFIDYIEGKKIKSELISNIDDHVIPARIMSAIYESAANQKNQGRPISQFNF